MTHLPFSYWSASHSAPPPEKDYVLIDPEKGRMISSVTLPEAPHKRIPLSIWYQEDSPHAILSRLRPDAEWSRSTYRLEDDAIHWRWSGSDKEHTWHRVQQEELPEWFDKILQRAHDKMDALERNPPS